MTPFCILLDDRKDCNLGVRSSTDTFCEGRSPSPSGDDGWIVIASYLHIGLPSGPSSSSSSVVAMSLWDVARWDGIRFLEQRLTILCVRI